MGWPCLGPEGREAALLWVCAAGGPSACPAQLCCRGPEPGRAKPRRHLQENLGHSAKARRVGGARPALCSKSRSWVGTPGRGPVAHTIPPPGTISTPRASWPFLQLFLPPSQGSWAEEEVFGHTVPAVRCGGGGHSETKKEGEGPTTRSVRGQGGHPHPRYSQSTREPTTRPNQEQGQARMGL